MNALPGADTPALAALDAASVRGAAGDPDANLEASLVLQPSEVVLVHTTRPALGTLLADLCTGVVSPDAGAVRFLGHDWSELDDDDVNALRSLIGRVFYRANWLDHLSVADNVLLPQLHHTRLSRPRLLDDAIRLARRFGLPGLPDGHPNEVDPGELQRAACVRAFLGAPQLLLLEHPSAGSFPEILAPLVDAMRAACTRGAAVVWITPSERVWRDPWIPISRRLRISGRTLVGGGATS